MKRKLLTALGGIVILTSLAFGGSYTTKAWSSYAAFNPEVDTLSMKTFGCNQSATIFDSYATVNAQNVANAYFQGGPQVEVIFVPSSPNDAPANGVMLNFDVSYSTNTISGAIAQVLDANGTVLYDSSTGGSFVTIGSASAEVSDLWLQKPDGTYSTFVLWQALGVRANNSAVPTGSAISTVRYTLTSITPLP